MFIEQKRIAAGNEYVVTICVTQLQVSLLVLKKLLEMRLSRFILILILTRDVRVYLHNMILFVIEIHYLVIGIRFF